MSVSLHGVWGFTLTLPSINVMGGHYQRMGTLLIAYRESPRWGRGANRRVPTPLFFCQQRIFGKGFYSYYEKTKEHV
jgi:hypothetical protein